jgi:hypothetical protein
VDACLSAAAAKAGCAREELKSHHSLAPLADHVTGYALAALGETRPLVETHQRTIHVQEEASS